MNEELMAQLIAELCTDLGIDETQTEDPKYKKLMSKLNSSIRAITREIGFPDYYKQEDISVYLERYYDNIKDLTLYDFLQNGATGEITHSENGINRSWKSRRECFLGVVRFAKSFK